MNENGISKWEQREVDECVEFLRNREKKCRIIHLMIQPGLNNRDIITRIKSSIPSISHGFVLVVYVKKSDYNNILDELFSDLYPECFSRIFFYDELLVCPLDNIFVPEHRLCSQQDVDEMLKKYKITLQQLPRMLSSDIISRWNGWREGNVIAITRKGRDQPYYRLVV